MIFPGWEQRVTQTPQADTPRPTSQTHRTLNTPLLDVRDTPPSKSHGVESTEKPVSDIRASWKQKDADTQPKREEEPTAYSVGDRMSAWETMSSSNKVSKAFTYTLYCNIRTRTFQLSCHPADE